MANEPFDNSDTLKRIKQLENQNLKFRNLLKTALEMTKQDDAGISNLTEEATSLKETIENLENEKIQLEKELITVTQDSGNEMMQTVSKLEKEHGELKSKFEDVLNEIKKGALEIEYLKSEDAELKRILAELEKEKLKLLQEIKKVDETASNLSHESVKLQEKLSQLESQRTSLYRNLNESEDIKEPPNQNDLTSNDIISNFESLEKTYKEYVEALQEHRSLSQKIYDLEEKKEGLLTVVQKTNNEEMKYQKELNETIIKSNTNLLMKIKEVKSKLQENLEVNNNFMKTLETPNDLNVNVAELEKEKDILYGDLERTLAHSTKEMNKLTENSSDPEVKRLVNEIEIQKAVLLYNLSTLKSGEDDREDLDENKVLQFSATELSENMPGLKEATNILPKISNEIPDEISKDVSKNPSSSKHKDCQLLEEITRLEQERRNLLKRINSISSSCAIDLEETTSFEENSQNTQNERVLQTQSELHSTFMKEESSQDLPVNQNYDDATNQLYADEDARLEQRIRELEIENARIKTELEYIMQEIKNEQSKQ